MAPLLFANAESILWGDIKCTDKLGRFPCAAVRAPAGVDLHVPVNAWYRSRSIEGEFVATWLHMRARRMQVSTAFKLESCVGVTQCARPMSNLHRLMFSRTLLVNYMRRLSSPSTLSPQLTLRTTLTCLQTLRPSPPFIVRLHIYLLNIPW